MNGPRYRLPRHPAPITLRVHELAKAGGQASIVALWLLRLIGHRPKSTSSKVTLGAFEVQTFVRILSQHTHEPMPSTITEASHQVQFALCICGTGLTSTSSTRGADIPWRVRRTAGIADTIKRNPFPKP